MPNDRLPHLALAVFATVALAWPASAGAQATGSEAARRAKEVRLDEQRAMLAARELYGVGCPVGFNLVIFSVSTLLCHVDVPVRIAMSGCPADKPNYFARIGARDACLRNNFLPEGRLETVGRQGTDYVYAEPMGDAIERAEEQLERSYGQRLVAKPPAGLRDAGRFIGRAVQVPQAPAEHMAVPLSVRVVLDALGEGGEDASLVSFRVFAPSSKSKS